MDNLHSQNHGMHQRSVLEELTTIQFPPVVTGTQKPSAGESTNSLVLNVNYTTPLLSSSATTSQDLNVQKKIGEFYSHRGR